MPVSCLPCTNIAQQRRQPRFCCRLIRHTVKYIRGCTARSCHRHQLPSGDMSGESAIDPSSGRRASDDVQHGRLSIPFLCIWHATTWPEGERATPIYTDVRRKTILIASLLFAMLADAVALLRFNLHSLSLIVRLLAIHTLCTFAT